MFAAERMQSSVRWLETPSLDGLRKTYKNEVRQTVICPRFKRVLYRIETWVVGIQWKRNFVASCEQQAWDVMLFVRHSNALATGVRLFTSSAKCAVVLWYLQTVSLFLRQTERRQLSTSRTQFHKLRYSVKCCVVQQIVAEFRVSAVNLCELSVWPCSQVNCAVYRWLSEHYTTLHSEQTKYSTVRYFIYISEMGSYIFFVFPV